MRFRPDSSILKGKQSRWPAAYNQAFAVVDVGKGQWDILASTKAFDTMAGRHQIAHLGQKLGLLPHLFMYSLEVW